eukprot:gene5231-6361_t
MAGKGRHPRIDETLMFHQVSPELMMEIQVIDSRSIWLRSSNVLGSLSLPLHEIIKHGHTSRTYELRHGKSATISLNFVWRQLIDAKMLAPEVLRKINTRSFSVNGLDDILVRRRVLFMLYDVPLIPIASIYGLSDLAWIVKMTWYSMLG